MTPLQRVRDLIDNVTEQHLRTIEARMKLADAAKVDVLLTEVNELHRALVYLVEWAEGLDSVFEQPAEDDRLVAPEADNKQ